VGAAVRLARLLRRERIDLVEAYGFKCGLVARVACLLGRRPALVIAVRGLHFTEAEDPDGLKTRFVLAVERALEPTVARYDANSRGARNFLVGRGFAASRFTVIVNGVDAESVPAANLAVHTGPPAIVCVARFVPRKRHDVLIRALAQVRDAGQDFRCELIGYGPTVAEAEALVAEFGLGDRVGFAGRLDQPAIARRLATADIFILTSLWEGMPGSVLEAMAAALPVVGSDVNGTNEVIVSGVTGTLVPPADVEATAAALLELARDPGLRVRMGRAGRERIEREYSFERVVAEKEAFYCELLG